MNTLNKSFLNSGHVFLCHFQELSFDAGRFFFKNMKLFANYQRVCDRVYFKHEYIMILLGKMFNRFDLARAKVYNSKCQMYEVIPAMYSRVLDLCFFSHIFEPHLLFNTTNCQLMCDSKPSKKDWYKMIGTVR